MQLTKALRIEIGGVAPPVISFVGGGGKTSSMVRLAAELRSQGVRVVCTSTTRLAAYEVESTSGIVEVVGDMLPMDAIARALDEFGQCLLVTPEIVEGGMQKYPGVKSAAVDALAARASALGIGAIIVEADGAKMLPLKAPLAHEPPLPASTTLLAPFAGMDALGRRIEPAYIHRPDRVRALLGLDQHAEERITPARLAEILLSKHGGRKNCPAAAFFMPVLNKAEGMPERASARITARILAEQGAPSLVASTGCMACEAVHERWGPTAAIVLAAGEGKRFGAPKQLAVVDGASLIVHAVATALESGVNQVVVVTGAYADRVEGCVRAAFVGARVRIVRNNEWESGQASSMHAGLHALDDGVQAALLMPADQPRLCAALLRRMLRQWRAGWDIAVPQAEGRIRGAPALFDRRFWPELLRTQGDTGGRGLLRSYAGQVGAVPAEANLLSDVDTLYDLGDRML